MIKDVRFDISEVDPTGFDGFLELDRQGRRQFVLGHLDHPCLATQVGARAQLH